MPRVLVLEDDPDVCNSIKTALVRSGIQVEYAYHAKEAWRVLHRLKPDLLILDITLPEVNGWEFARRIRSDTAISKLPIVVITKSKSITLRWAGWVYGVSDFVDKPIKRYELDAAVQKALGAPASE